MKLPEFQSFAVALRGMNRGNAAELKQLIARSRALREACREHGVPELAYCLNAVGNLLAAMTGPGEFIDLETLQSTLMRLLDSVEKSLEGIPAGQGRTLSASKGLTSAAEPKPAPLSAARAAAQEAAATEPDPPRIEVLFDIDAAQEDKAQQSKPKQVAAPLPAASKPSASPVSRAAEARRALRMEQQEREDKLAQDTLLGKILIELGQLDQADLLEALELNRSSKLPLGECLLLKGMVEPEKIMEGLRLQERLRAELRGVGQERGLAARGVQPAAGGAAQASVGPQAPSLPVQMHVTKQMFLGEVFLGANLITNEQLEKAMHLHQLKGLRVGQALLQIGAIDEAQLERGLEMQKRLRAVALHSSADAKARVRGD